MEPARLFSTGRQAKSHSPLTVASKASSKLGKPMASPSGAKAMAASSLNAPATPWNATRVALLLIMAVSLLRRATPRTGVWGQGRRPRRSLEPVDLALDSGQFDGHVVEFAAELL